MQNLFSYWKPIAVVASLTTLAIVSTSPGSVLAGNTTTAKSQPALPINLEAVRQTPGGNQLVNWLDPVLSLVATAAVEPQATADRPFLAEDSAYFLQINFAEMRQSPAGSQLFDWVNDEILEEIADELGDDLGQDFAENLDGISIFGAGDEQDPVILLHGYLTQQLHDHLRSSLLEEGDAVSLESRNGIEYFAIDDHDIDFDVLKIDSDDDTIFYSIGNIGHGQSLITTSEDVLDEFLNNGAMLNSALTSELIVLQANRPLLQGALNTRHEALSDGPWESNFIKNVEQFGFVLADENDTFDIRLQAITKTPSMASALANLAEGLISLKTIADDGDGDLDWVDRLNISHDDNITQFNLQVPADQLIDILD